MDLYTAIKGRRAVRQYEAREVPRAAVERILEAASWAPSGMNEQPWEYYVVSGTRKDRIAAYYSEVIAAGMPQPEARTEQQRNIIRRAAAFGGAPLLLAAVMPAETVPGRRKMGLESVAASFENLLLAAYAEGLGTCWMTGPLRDGGEAVKAILGIGADREVVALTPLGYPAETPPAPPRLDPGRLKKVIWLED